MKLSIVSTLFCSAPYVREFHTRATKAANELVGDSYEIILVNDGSPDNSLELAIEISESDEHTVVVDLSRNFGHHKAMMTGLSYARGEQVFLIDSDLEEEPEWLGSFSNLFRSEDCDVVFGVQSKRKGGLFERVSGHFFYRLFRFLTGVNQPDNIVTARLMSRRYVEALLLYRERELSIGGVLTLTGFTQIPFSVNKHSSSPSTYSLSRKLQVFIISITSFSSKPLEAIFYCGVFFSFTAFLYILWLVFRYVYIATPPSGYTSIVVSIWFFSGLLILFIGIIGIYLARVFTEVKQRPYTIVRATHRHPNSM